MARKIPTDAFAYYLALGAGRSYGQVAEHYQVSKTAIANLAAKEKWRERALEHERRAQETSAARATETLEDLNDRHLRMLRAIQQKALATLKQMPLSTAMEAVRALELSIKQERLVLGEPTERTASQIESMIKREGERWLRHAEDREN